MGKTSQTLGFLIGQRIAGQRNKQKEPTAYLFNGKRLPPLPAWDKETYPYAVLRAMDSETTPYAVYYSKMRPTLNSSGKVFVCSLEYHGIVTYCDYTNNALVWRDKNTALLTSTTVDGVFWTNTDILTEDGTLYLSASDPIPVYE